MCFCIFRLVNQNDESNSKSAYDAGSIFKRGAAGGWGLKQFYKRNDLLDPTHGFIKLDTIIIKTTLQIYVKTSTTMLR